ncbi:MAG: C-compound, carbohydrate catabolism; transcriptional control, partial [uncultured Phycisphaerae bacterium]
DDDEPPGPAPARAERRGGAAAAGHRPQGAGGRPRDPLRPAVQPADAGDGGERAAVREGLRRLGRRPAGQPVPDPCRQGAGAAQGPLPCQHRGHPGGRGAGAAAPDRDELQRRGRGDQERHDHPQAGRLHPAAAVRGAGPAGGEADAGRADGV